MVRLFLYTSQYLSHGNLRLPIRQSHVISRVRLLVELGADVKAKSKDGAVPGRQERECGVDGAAATS